MAVLPPELTYPKQLEDKEEFDRRVDETEEEIVDKFFCNPEICKALSQLKDDIESFEKMTNDEDDVKRLKRSLIDNFRDYLDGYNNL